MDRITWNICQEVMNSRLAARFLHLLTSCCLNLDVQVDLSHILPGRPFLDGRNSPSHEETPIILQFFLKFEELAALMTTRGAYGIKGVYS